MNCLCISRESVTFAAELEKSYMNTLNLNILSIIIRIRLQHVGGSDKVCI